VVFRGPNILVEGELGSFHSTETRFDLVWQWCTRDSSPVKILLIISSPSACRKKCYNKGHIQLIFPQSFSFLGTYTLSETSNDHALCCMLHHGSTLVQLLHCLSLSSCQLESTFTRFKIASVAISIGWHVRTSSATFKRHWEHFSTQLWTALRDKHFPP
jgi:hypothetical protein